MTSIFIREEKGEQVQREGNVQKEAEITVTQLPGQGMPKTVGSHQKHVCPRWIQSMYGKTNTML